MLESSSTSIARWPSYKPRIKEYKQPYKTVVHRLCTISGCRSPHRLRHCRRDRNRYERVPRGKHLSSWAGLCPGNNESAGKRLTGRTRKAAATSAGRWSRTPGAYRTWKDAATGVFYRIARRRGMQKAAIAVAHRILEIAYYVIRDGVEYRDPGGDYVDRHDPERIAKRLLADWSASDSLSIPSSRPCSVGVVTDPNSPVPADPGRADQRVHPMRRLGPLLHSRAQPKTATLNRGHPTQNIRVDLAYVSKERTPLRPRFAPATM